LKYRLPLLLCLKRVQRLQTTQRIVVQVQRPSAPAAIGCYQRLQKNFDRIAAFKKQKELLLLKRNRTDKLIQLLSRLEKGEQCMSFKEFDLSPYIRALEDFKSKQTEDVINHWGSIENFDIFIQKVKDHEPEIAKLAMKQFESAPF